MALIACPECAKQISTLAAACPHCGYPMREAEVVKAKIEEEATWQRWLTENSKMYPNKSNKWK